MKSLIEDATCGGIGVACFCFQCFITVYGSGQQFGAIVDLYCITNKVIDGSISLILVVDGSTCWLCSLRNSMLVCAIQCWSVHVTTLIRPWPWPWPN